jgi:hypothetical protein
MFDKLHSHASAPTPSARQLNPAVPRSLEAILNRMMAKRPRDRFQGVHELVADLERVRFESTAAPGRVKSLSESAIAVVPVAEPQEKPKRERAPRDDRALHDDRTAAPAAPLHDAEQVAVRVAPQLGSTRHDRVTSFLMSLVLIVGVSVVWLGAVWLTNRVWADAVPAEIESITLGGGDPLGAADDMLEMDTLAEQIDELASPVDEFQEQEVEAILPNVLDVVAEESFDLIDPRQTSQKEDRGVEARQVGRGARGFGEGPGAGGLSREDRWEIVYDKTQTLREYARQLDYFDIELGAILGRDRLVYLSNVASRQPVQRVASGGTEDSRMYLLWRGGGRQRADTDLFRQAGVDVRNAILMQFLPPELEARLFQSEMEYARERRREREEIRQTRFGVRQNDGGGDYEFYVIDQAYL